MARFILRRLLRGLVALLLFQSLLFAMLHAVPGDYASIAGAFGGRAARAFLQRQLGLDLPLGEQYLRWLARFLSFDLGASFQYPNPPVSDLLLTRAPRTLLLFLSAAVLSYILGIWLGKLVAWRRGGLIELGAMLGGVAAYTSFAPWLGFLALNIFGWTLGWFPYQNLINFNIWLGASVSMDWVLARMVVNGALLLLAILMAWQLTAPLAGQRRWLARLASVGLFAYLSGAWWAQSGAAPLALDILDHLVLPLGTVVLLSFGETMMIMRTSMLETMNDDHVAAARAKGLRDSVVRDRHVARIALLPAITRLLLNLPFVLVGSLVIERVFFWRAMGQVLFNAVEFQDLPVILGILSAVGLVTLLAHIALDILYVYLDPRLRYAGVTYQ